MFDFVLVLDCGFVGCCVCLLLFMYCLVCGSCSPIGLIFWLGLVMLLVFSLIRWVGFACGGWF